MIKAYSKIIKLIQSDYYRKTGKVDSLFHIYICTFFDRGLKYMFWFRLANHQSFFIHYPARIRLKLLQLKYHIDIPYQTDIDYGFRLGHGGPCVINPSAKIGKNCTILPNCTIGSLNQKAAIIGDNVYIGPSVCIVENVIIGNGVTIGAGSVVVKNVEAGCTVAGNPAKVISHKKPGRFIWNKWG